MNPATVKVCPGVCGFAAKVTVHETNGRIVAKTDSACPMVRTFVDKITGSDSYEIALTSLDQNPVAKLAGESKLHAACPVPVAMIKATEVCAGLALPRPVEISFA